MKNKLALLASVAGFCVVFYPTFTWMYQRFNEPESYYGHGFLIPLIVAYLIWDKRRQLAAIPASCSRAGLALLVVSLAVHLVALFFKVGFVSGIALVGTLCGFAWYVYGSRRFSILLFPLLFLLLMVPLPKVLLIAITFKLKMLAAAIAAWLMSFTSLNIVHSGSRFILPNGVLAVENECSGINSLISMLTLSILFAYFAEKSALKRTLFVLASLPVAIVANVCRIIFLILAAYIYGIGAVKNGLLHYGDGIVMWVAALFFLYMLWRFFQWDRHK
jgi:exosortase